MEYDKDKVDDMVLALMSLVLHSDRFATRAWKDFDWDSLNRLYEKGFISNPVGKAKSVVGIVRKEQVDQVRRHD